MHGSAESLQVELRDLIFRLRRSVLLNPLMEKRLRMSEFERAKLSSNFQYARDLLTRLEQDACAMRSLPKRQETQSSLNHQRELLEQLTDRLVDFAEIAARCPENDDSEDEEDLLAHIPAIPSQETSSMAFKLVSINSANNDQAPTGTSRLLSPDSLTTLILPRDTTHSMPNRSTQPIESTDTSSTLRQRGTMNAASRPARSSSPEHKPAASSTAREALFSGRKPRPSSPGATSTNTEAIMDLHRAEQDSLSDAMLRMASRLKETSRGISRSLELDREALTRAADGISGTEQGIETAGRRMGILRQVTEGKGWIGRMLLFAYVYGLMIALLVLVFVIPKLGF